MIPIERYQPGGDIYQTIVQQYGTAGAQKVYQAALTGDRTAISEAIGELRDGPPLEDSTAALFLDQIATNPLAAPLGAANTVIGNSVLSFLKNPMVLLAAGVVLFLFFGGAEVIRKMVKKLG